MCEFIKFIEKQNCFLGKNEIKSEIKHKIEDSKNTIQHTKHTKHYLDDELVQTSFENLVKKPRVHSVKTDTNVYAKVDTSAEDNGGTGKFIYFIEVNGKVYNISKPKLDKLEPKSILLKINEVEFNTKYNENNETLEYLDKLDYFELIFDYLQGYPVENIQYIFNGKENNFDDTIEQRKQYSNLDKFITLVHRLKMYNLLDKIYGLYSYIYIYDFAILCNKNTITKIEPENTLLNPQNNKYYLKHYFYHNRDINIFKKYLMKYILGLQDLQTTITNILKLRDGSDGDTPEHQNKQEKKYEFQKVLNDIEYYGFNILLKKIRYFI